MKPFVVVRGDQLIWVDVLGWCQSIFWIKCCFITSYCVLFCNYFPSFKWKTTFNLERKNRLVSSFLANPRAALNAWLGWEGRWGLGERISLMCEEKPRQKTHTVKGSLKLWDQVLVPKIYISLSCSSTEQSLISFLDKWENATDKRPILMNRHHCFSTVNPLKRQLLLTWD